MKEFKIKAIPSKSAHSLLKLVMSKLSNEARTLKGMSPVKEIYFIASRDGKGST